MNADADFDDATLMAYVDGELDASTRAAVESAMALNPDVAARVATHVVLRDRLRSAYDPVLSEPLPERLVRQLSADSVAPQPVSITSLAGHRARQGRRAHHWSWPEWGSLAASVALGIVVGQQVLQPSVPVVARDGALVAQGALMAGLSEQAGGAPSEAGAVQIGISFKNRAGNYCRTFQMAAGTAGFACREGTEWRVKMLTENQSRPEDPGNYRLAAASLPSAVLSAVEAAIDGEPLDADGEAAARKTGWR